MSRWRITRSIKLGGLEGSFLPRQPASGARALKSGPSMVGLQEGPFQICSEHTWTEDWQTGPGKAGRAASSIELAQLTLASSS